MRAPELRQPAPPAAWRPALGLSAIDPAWAAFVGSLILSLVAVVGSDGPNRDGMLYLDNARVFLEDGFAAAFRHYDWPFMAIATAWLSQLTGLGLENAGYLLCAVLLAGVCALLVRLTQHRFPDAGWAACLVALALPAFNEYRDYLIREFGFWLFSLLAILLVLRWTDKPSWRGALALHVSIAAAALFRLEAVALYPALLLWQLAASPHGERPRRIAMLGSAPLAAIAAIALMLLVAGKDGIGGRLEYYLSSLDPWAARESFRAAAGRMAAALYGENPAGHTSSILFLGLLASIPVKFVEMTGVFVVPLAVAFGRTPARVLFARWQPMTWIFPIYCLALMVFAVHQLFLVGRHVSFLNVLAVPLIAAGLADVLARHARWRAAILTVVVVSAFANVLSLGPGKEQYVKAGAWLAANVPDRARVYAGSDRAAFYAGWPYGEVRSALLGREALDHAVRAGRYDLIVLDSIHKRDAWLPAWAAQVGVVEVTRFSNAHGDAVIVFRPRAQADAAVTSAARAP